MEACHKIFVLLLIVCTSNQVLGQEEKREATTESINPETTHNVEKKSEEKETGTFGSHELIGIVILSVMGVIMLVQLLSWTIYYVKSKKGLNSHSLLSDFDEHSIESV